MNRKTEMTMPIFGRMWPNIVQVWYENEEFERDNHNKVRYWNHWIQDEIELGI